jgi:hypothetical protein
MTCELCTLERKINIYIEDDHYIIMDCDSCKILLRILDYQLKYIRIMYK